MVCFTGKPTIFMIGFFLISIFYHYDWPISLYISFIMNGKIMTSWFFLNLSEWSFTIFRYSARCDINTLPKIIFINHIMPSVVFDMRIRQLAGFNLFFLITYCHPLIFFNIFLVITIAWNFVLWSHYKGILLLVLYFLSSILYNGHYFRILINHVGYFRKSYYYGCCCRCCHCYRSQC